MCSTSTRRASDCGGTTAVMTAAAAMREVADTACHRCDRLGKSTARCVAAAAYGVATLADAAKAVQAVQAVASVVKKRFTVAADAISVAIIAR